MSLTPPVFTFIADEEGGTPVAILADLPNGDQIWSGSISSALFEAQIQDTQDQLGSDSGDFIVHADRGEVRVLARAADPDAAMILAEAYARLLAARRGRNKGTSLSLEHCRRGHPFDEGNTFIDSRGDRGCVECRRIGQRERRRLKKVPVRSLLVQATAKSDRAEGAPPTHTDLMVSPESIGPWLEQDEAARKICDFMNWPEDGPAWDDANKLARSLREIGQAEGVAALQQAGEPVAFELGAFKSWTGGADVVSYIARYGGMCRGCADEHGICPGSGLPCDDVEKPIRHVLEALSYGLRHGFITLPQQTALVEQGVEKIIGQHEPAACGASAPSEPPRSDGRCSTCRHFTPEANGFGSCARWRTGYGVSADELASDEVLVENDEGWGMLAGPNFGCVLHNPPAGGEG